MKPIISKIDALSRFRGLFVNKNLKAFIATMVLMIIYFTGLYFNQKEPSCIESDLWIVSDWGSCSQDGFQKRIVTIRQEAVSCRKDKDYPEPMSVRTCTPICSESDYKISDWSICSGSGKQDRIITKVEGVNCILPEIVKEQKCDPIPSNNKVSLFPKGGYTTQVDTSIENGYYSNNNNLSIILSGQINSLKLNLTAKTTIADGSLIRRPVYYYFLFSINDSVPRIIGTSRNLDGNIAYTGEGIFSGLDTPKTFSFDLTSQRLAKAKNPKEGVGSVYRNYIDILNKNKGKSLAMTLYVGNGKSMNEPDINKRIFGTITEAYLEYTCVTGTKCEIKVN